MKSIIILSNNENVAPLYNWLKNRKEYNVYLFHEKINIALLNSYNPFFIISYNYKYIVTEDIVEKMGDRIINLHISYLPWNRGSSPNFWSFIENTPKGVTIHRLEKGLDTGKIIAQKELFFDEDKETLSTTYKILNDEIVELFKSVWDEICTGNYTMYNQNGVGSYHTVLDMKKLLGNQVIDYNAPISILKNRLQMC